MFLLMATLNKRICLGRRLDGVEQKLNGHDQAQRNLMEQIMKLSQEMKVHSTLDLVVTLVSQESATKSRETTKLEVFYYINCNLVTRSMATKSR